MIGDAGNKLVAHEFAGLFPPMTEQEYQALKSDIAANGQREPICIQQGKILDGLHRYRACCELGIEPRTREWDGEGSELAYVVSANLFRRHLGTSQKAMVAARLARLGEGRPAATARKSAVSQAEAAELLKVGRRLVQDAKQVQERGVPALVEAVDRGAIRVTPALAIAGLGPEEQAESLAEKLGTPGSKAASPRTKANAGAAGVREHREAGPDGPGQPPVSSMVGAGRDVGMLPPPGWLEGLKLRSRLADPTYFDIEATLWRAADLLTRPLGPPDRTELFTAWYNHHAGPVGFARTVKHPDHWNWCRQCEGGKGTADGAICSDCLGHGYTTKRVRMKDRVWGEG